VASSVATRGRFTGVSADVRSDGGDCAICTLLANTLTALHVPDVQPIEFLNTGPTERWSVKRRAQSWAGPMTAIDVVSAFIASDSRRVSTAATPSCGTKAYPWLTPRMVPRPKACKRFSKRLSLIPRFSAHLAACPGCKALVKQLDRESERDIFLLWGRN
jgi:hypothetical protein